MPRRPLWLAAVAAAIATLLVLAACLLGATALTAGFEGPRPLSAVFASVLLVFAGLLTSWTTSAGAAPAAPGPAPTTRRAALWGISVAGSAVALYVFIAAAPGPPAFHDSWPEFIAAALGLSVAVVGLRLLAVRLMWALIGTASATLVAASIVVSVG